MTRILVADDDPDILRLVQVKLKKAGFEVVVARDGAEALEKVVTDQPDLVLLDGMMPKIDGYTATRRIKSEISPAPIVILLTAKGQESDVARGIQEGADDYIIKPFAPGDLVARVHLALSKSNKLTGSE